MDSDSAAANALTAGMFGFGMVILVIALALTVFFAWLFWRIFARTGMNGALGLLCLVPSIGPLICLLILAFSRWPIEDALVSTGHPGMMPAPPPPPAPPGSSVMPT